MKKSLYCNKDPENINLSPDEQILLEEELYRKQIVHNHGWKPGEYEEISQAKTLWGKKVSNGQVKK